MPGMKGTMNEFKQGKLHSGSKKGPVVKSRAQAIAIGMSEERGEKKNLRDERGEKKKKRSGGLAQFVK